MKSRTESWRGGKKLPKRSFDGGRPRGKSSKKRKKKELISN